MGKLVSLPRRLTMLIARERMTEPLAGEWLGSFI